MVTESQNLAGLVKFAGEFPLDEGPISKFLGNVNPVLTKILKVYVRLRRFYYADESQRSQQALTGWRLIRGSLK